MRRGQILRANKSKIITGKGLIFLIYKEFLEIEKGKDISPIEMGQNRQVTERE